MRTRLDCTFDFSLPPARPVWHLRLGRVWCSHDRHHAWGIQLAVYCVYFYFGLSRRR